jgi:hypothetical protein
LIRPEPSSSLSAMNVQTNKLAQSARSESLCGFCGRQWFGSVAYCPYCGCKTNLTTQEPDDLSRRDEALATEGILAIPAGELDRQEPKSAPQSTSRQINAESVAPLQGVPISGEPLPVKRDRATPSQLNKTATLLFKTVAAGVSALLLFWIMVKLLAPETNEGASPQLPIATSGIASPGPAPSTSAAPVPSIPLRTDTAVPAAEPAARQLERDAAQAAPPSLRSLCSVANETAGLCKSQK